MFRWRFTFALLAIPGVLGAQQPAARDSGSQHPDTVTRPPVRLQEVTVTAAPARKESPSSAVTVTPATIQQTVAIDQYDLLRQAAGIEVHDQGQGPGFASDASVRGFSSDHSTDLALWIDGVPINEPINGHAEGYNDWNVMFPQAVRTVDVIKGPVSPVYGNFAMAGTVNVRTLERMNGTQAWATGGAYGRLEGVVLTGFDREGSGGVFGLRGEHESGWRPNSSYDLGQGHARVVKDLSPSTTLDGGVELYLAGWDSPGFLTLDQFERGEYGHVSNPSDGGYKHRAQERASLRVLSGSNLLWRSTVYATQGRWQLFLTTPPEGGKAEGTGSQTEEEDTRYGFGLTSALTWSLPKATVTLGAEGRWDHADYENWLTTDRARDSSQTLVGARQVSGALFLEGTGDVTSRLRLSVGGRLDGLNTNSTPEADPTVSAGKSIVSPKFGALYHLTGPVDLYGNVSRGFRQSDGVIEDPTLPFITAWSYETGLKLGAKPVSASLAVFRMDVSNEQTFNPITLTSTSGGRSRRQGIEVGGRVQATDAVAVTADWTFNDAKYQDFVTEDGDTLSGTRVFNTARFVGTAAVELAPTQSTWRLRASTNIVGPYTPFDEPGVEVPTYALFHLHGDVRIGRALLGLGVRNLFDHAYTELRAGGFVVPGQPRSVYGDIQYALTSTPH
jgi:iron complex outermembrane recepter protein